MVSKIYREHVGLTWMAGAWTTMAHFVEGVLQNLRSGPEVKGVVLDG